MAIQSVCCIFDRALGAYLRPFTTPTTAVALRSYLDVLGDKSSDVAKHPHDYELHHLASFDDESGTFVKVGFPDRLLYRHTVTTNPEGSTNVQE